MKHPDVIGVGIGYREQAGEIDSSLEPCLVVSVRKKQGASKARLIPRWLSCTDPKLGRVAVKTDVVNMGTVKLQASIVPSPTVKAGSKTGSVFGIGHLGDSRFMLTAGHVVADRKHDSKITWKSGVLGGHGKCHRALNFQPTSDPAILSPGLLDVGLVPSSDVGPLGKWQMFPSGESVLSWQEALTQPKVVICGRSRLVPAKLARTMTTGHEDLLIKGRPYLRCLLYDFVDTATKSGDSGAAVITEGGALVGIHLGVWRDQETGKRYSICQSAGDILGAVKWLLGEKFAIYTKAG